MTMNETPLSTKLFSRAGITLATLLGSPLAGCTLLALNYRRLNQPRHARLSLIWGTVATIIITLVAMFLPENFPSLALPAAYTFTIYNLATTLQWRTYTSHVERGGGQASLWAAAGIGVAGLGIVYVFIAILVFVFPRHWLVE